MNFQKSFSQDLLKIVSKAVNNKIYGSVEIYFEAGSITQITQRIINKIRQPKKNILHKKDVKPPQVIQEIPPPHASRPA